MKKRTRRVGSVKSELIRKSREAALTAVQIFNNPNMIFKSESYIVLMIIAWTYLLHAYYKSKNIVYRYYTLKNGRKKYEKTKYGAYKNWELERCLNNLQCPIDNDTKNNLKFLIGLRHEIEHQMTTSIDNFLSARFQACCLNYNSYVKKLFGNNLGIENHLSFSLQFSTISIEQKRMLEEFKELPRNIIGYIKEFDDSLTSAEFESEKYAYRIFFVQKTANRKGQADRVIEFLRGDDPLAKGINKEYVMLKETEKKKYLPHEIVNEMHNRGFSRFKIYHHTLLWKEKDAKNPNKKLGVLVSDKWYWYENWLKEVEEHCKRNKEKYV